MRYINQSSLKQILGSISPRVSSMAAPLPSEAFTLPLLSQLGNNSRSAVKSYTNDREECDFLPSARTMKSNVIQGPWSNNPSNPKLPKSPSPFSK